MTGVIFKVGNEQLRGAMFYPDTLKAKNPGVLFIHGWTSGQDRYFDQAKTLTDLGIICLTFDLRGHGTSDGDINTQTRQDFLDDALAAYDFLTANINVDAENVTIIGSSFGAYLAALITSHRKVKNVVLRVPANYPNGGFDEPQAKYSNQVEILKWRYEVKNPQDTLALLALHKFRGHVLVVESDSDEIIPHQTIQNYLDAVHNKEKLRYIVMKNAPHSITDYPDLKKQFYEIVIDWLKDKL